MTESPDAIDTPDAVDTPDADDTADAVDTPDAIDAEENKGSVVSSIPNRVFTLACWMDAFAMASSSAGFAFARVAADRLAGRNPSFKSSCAPEERVAAAEALMDTLLFLENDIGGKREIFRFREQCTHYPVFAGIGTKRLLCYRY